MDMENHALLRRLSYMDQDRVLTDELTQICGCGVVLDMTGLQFAHLTPKQSMSEAKIETRIWQ
ncbi:unnamed protein product, partial [Echinostoma caproni]|uniref:HNH endonuclease n=1 Tax=Echinostoma caproni TaxID=27848 RepID=A0A183A3Y4_9TREM